MSITNQNMTRIFDIHTNTQTILDDAPSYSDPEEAFKDVIKGDKKRLAAYKGYLDLLRDYSGNSLLHVAVLVENVDLVKFFLERRFDVYYRNKANKNSWDLALRSQNKEIVRLFSDHESLYKERNDELVAKNSSLLNQTKILEKNNLELTRKNNSLETENNILRLHNKRFRDEVDILTADNNELKESNKRLKTSLDNMMKSFKK